MNSNNNILHITNFSSDLNGHGGNHRTAQITELLEMAGFKINHGIPTTGSTRLDRYIRGINIWASLNFKYLKDFRTLGNWGNTYIAYQNSFKNHSGSKVAIWEATTSYWVPHLANDNKFKVIAMPQNIESLVMDQGSFNLNSTLKNFEYEIMQLVKSDAVFCISREEQWLLNLLNIDANFLPYYPAHQIVEELLDIRKSRSCSEKLRFLVLGSATNPPTLIGMIEQIKILERLNRENAFKIDIAGYGTEKLRKYCNNSSIINIIGAVSSSQLRNLMTDAIAVLIHQKAGVGALTRIPEMLIAGIPVIASANACRSAYTYDGIYSYDNQYDLVELMKSNLNIPKVPCRPIALEKQFIDIVTSFN